MTFSYECYIQISGQTLNLSTNDFCLYADFRFIYPRIKEMVKIWTNEEIDIKTHDFEIETGVYVKTWIKIIDLNHEIYNKSTLRITPKPEVDVKPFEVTQKIIVKPIEQKEDKKLIKCENHIKLFEAIVKAINIGWNLTKNQNWDQVFKKLSSDPYNKNLIVKLGLTENSLSSLFFKWTKYYATNYDSLNGKLKESHQKIFDSLKLVHILDLSRIYGETNPVPDVIKMIGYKEESKQYFNKYLINLWKEKQNSKEIQSEVQDSPYKRKKRKNKTFNYIDFLLNNPMGPPKAKNQKNSNPVIPKTVLGSDLLREDKQKSIQSTDRNHSMISNTVSKPNFTSKRPISQVIVFPKPKKTISLSEYKNRKQNSKTSEDNSDNISSNIKRETTLNNQSNELSQNTSDPRLKRTLQM